MEVRLLEPVEVPEVWPDPTVVLEDSPEPLFAFDDPDFNLEFVDF